MSFKDFEDAVNKMWEINFEDLLKYEIVLKKVIMAREEEWLEVEKEKRHLKAIEDYKLFLGNK